MDAVASEISLVERSSRCAIHIFTQTRFLEVTKILQNYSPKHTLATKQTRADKLPARCLIIAVTAAGIQLTAPPERFPFSGAGPSF